MKIRPLSKWALLGKIDRFWTGLKMNFELTLRTTSGLMNCFKAVDKSNRAKWVVLNEIQPTLRDLIFDAFKQSMRPDVVRKVIFEVLMEAHD